MVYLTIAGLVEAGLSVKEAGQLVSAQYDGDDDRAAITSKAVLNFFGNVEGADADKILALANKSFGSRLLEPEERAVLASLGIKDVDKAKALRTAAEVVRHSPSYRAALGKG